MSLPDCIANRRNLPFNSGHSPIECFGMLAIVLGSDRFRGSVVRIEPSAPADQKQAGRAHRSARLILYPPDKQCERSGGVACKFESLTALARHSLYPNRYSFPITTLPRSTLRVTSNTGCSFGSAQSNHVPSGYTVGGGRRMDDLAKASQIPLRQSTRLLCPYHQPL